MRNVKNNLDDVYKHINNIVWDNHTTPFQINIRLNYICNNISNKIPVLVYITNIGLIQEWSFIYKI